MVTVAVTLIVTLLACHDGRSARPSESVVQSVVLDSLFVRDTTKQIVVSDSTVAERTGVHDEDHADALRRLGPLAKGVRADFEARLCMRRRVDSLRARVPMRRFTVVERALLGAHRNPTSYWEAFYRRFPASPGLVTLSRVGFARDGNSALVRVDYGCGGRCGGTMYVLLANESGRWRVIRTARSRIS